MKKLLYNIKYIITQKLSLLIFNFNYNLNIFKRD